MARNPGSTPALVLKREGSHAAFTRDALVVEEPLEIRIREERGTPASFVVTMRTPGADEDLVTGLLFGEGMISSADEVLAIGGPDDPRIPAELARNLAIVTLNHREEGERVARRRVTVMGSACGVCGRTSIEDVLSIVRSCARREDKPGPVIGASILTTLPGRLRRQQTVFEATGGLHAAGLFEADGTLVLSREDVGRHNAADKAIGALLRLRRPAPPLMLVSGRLAFEIVQKAVLAGIRIVAAVSAPTSLAVELAEEAGVTLVGFLRGERFNVYTHPGQIAKAL